MTKRRGGDTWTTDDGEMVWVEEIDHTDVASVTRRNGAWWIAWTTELVEDQPYDEWFDCASSLKVAKRLAREGAEGFGAEGPFHWEPAEFGGWELFAIIDRSHEEFVE